MTNIIMQHSICDSILRHDIPHIVLAGLYILVTAEHLGAIESDTEC